MTEKMRYFFGAYFIIWGLCIIFVLPNDSPVKLMNYIIIGLYFCAILWWWLMGYPWWGGYWISALAITSVVTFGNLAVKQ